MMHDTTYIAGGGSHRGIPLVTFTGGECFGDAAGRPTIPKELESTMHVFYQSRLFDSSDALPKYLDFPAAFGGSGATADH